MSYTARSAVHADITDVFADAVRVPFADVRAGDWVFDAYGNRYQLINARVLKDGTLSIKRADRNFTEHHSPDASDYPSRFTIVPAHGWTKDGAGYRSINPDNPGRPPGEFTETCRCGEVFGSGADGEATTAADRLNEHANEANGREIY